MTSGGTFLPRPRTIPTSTEQTAERVNPSQTLAGIPTTMLDHWPGDRYVSMETVLIVASLPEPCSAGDGENMNLPNVDLAAVSEAQVVEYLLNPAHPDGAGKARFFAALGYSRIEWNVLAQVLHNLAAVTPVAKTVESDHGTKYIVEGPITGPHGRVATVRTVWIIDTGAAIPRLVTAYPCDVGDE